MSAAPTALGIAIDGYPALPGWADVWAAGPPGLEAAVSQALIFIRPDKTFMAGFVQHLLSKSDDRKSYLDRSEAQPSPLGLRAILT